MTRHWGVGSVYKRGTRYWISYSVNGKVYKESGGKTKAEARAKLQARKSEIFQGTFIGSHRAKVSINELLDSYVDHLKIEEAKSIDRVMSGLKTVRKEFGHIRAVDLTTKMHKTFILKQQESGNANATINRRTQALRAAYNLALREESLSKIPHFTILKEDNVRQGFFEKDEFEAVLKHLPDPYNDIAEFAYYTGWRKGEILCLSWAQVDRNAKEIRLVTSKNGEGRVIPLQGKLLGSINNRWQKREVELHKREPTFLHWFFIEKESLWVTSKSLGAKLVKKRDTQTSYFMIFAGLRLEILYGREFQNLLQCLSPDTRPTSCFSDTILLTWMTREVPFLMLRSILKVKRKTLE